MGGPASVVVDGVPRVPFKIFQRVSCLEFNIGKRSILGVDKSLINDIFLTHAQCLSNFGQLRAVPILEIVGQW